jgi:Putative mono-oxygenase ydhR
VNVFATTIRFSVPEGTDWEPLRQLMIRRAFDLFRHVPGLRSKAFVFSPERSEFGGNYVWETQDDAEAFLGSELFRESVQHFGTPRVERTEVCAYVEDGDLVSPPGYEWRMISSETLPPPLA